MQYKLPSLVLIARSAPLNATDMHGVFLIGGIHKNDTPIVLNNGASISTTHCASAFVLELKECGIELHGLSDTVKVEGIGWVTFLVYANTTKILRTPQR